MWPADIMLRDGARSRKASDPAVRLRSYKTSETAQIHRQKVDGAQRLCVEEGSPGVSAQPSAGASSAGDGNVREFNSGDDCTNLLIY